MSISDHLPATSINVTLSWSPVVTETNDIFTYEVGYHADKPDDTQCSSISDVNTLPDGFTPFSKTNDNSIVIGCLQPGTCYVFGVRVYSSRSELPGRWIFLRQLTTPLGKMVKVTFKIILLLILPCFICKNLLKDSLHLLLYKLLLVSTCELIIVCVKCGMVSFTK